MWPTPLARDHKGVPSDGFNNSSLPRAVRMYPTPQASDNRDRGNLSTPAIQRRIEKGKQSNLSMVVSDVSGSLNPQWVEGLMGYPPGWTELED